MRLIISFLIWLALLSAAEAQVTFDADTSTYTNGTGTTVTITNLTIGSGSNRALVLGLQFEASAIPSGLTATWNGTSLTAITGTNSGSHGGCSCALVMFGLVAPASGNHSLVISWTGSNSIHAFAVSFTGVDQTGGATSFPGGTSVVEDTATASPITGPVSSASGDIVVAAGMQDCQPWGAISGTTIATDLSGPDFGSAANYSPGAATVSPTFAFTGTCVFGFVGTDVKAASGGGGGGGKRRGDPGSLTTLGVGAP